MAGDWLKIELGTPDKPEVVLMASRLGINSDEVVGKLIRVWRWFNEHTTDGNANGVTYAFLDRIAGVTGFAEQMIFVGWLSENGSVFSVPNFDYHNGESAKKRAETQKRVAKHRLAKDECGNADVTKKPLQKALPEKRREDIKDAATNPVAHKSVAPQTPRDLIWTVGVSLLTDSGASPEAAKSFLGKLAKQGEPELASAIGYCAANPKIDPKAYLAKAMQPKTRQVVL